MTVWIVWEDNEIDEIFDNDTAAFMHYRYLCDKGVTTRITKKKVRSW